MRNLQFIIALIFSTFLFFNSNAQEEELITSEEIVSDSTALEAPEKKRKLRILGDYPNPKAALGLSLVLPGAGQAYNKKYWKIPIIYGVFGYLAYKIDDNKKNYEDFRDAYEIRVDGDDMTIDQYEGIYSDASLKRLRDLRKKGLESNWIFVVVTYLLNGVDAYVDAHLLEFDIDEDLSMNIDPTVMPATNGFNSAAGATPQLGLRLAFSF